MGDLPAIETTVSSETAPQGSYSYAAITEMLNVRGIRVSHMTVRRELDKNQHFTTVRVGRKIFVRSAAIDAFLAEIDAADAQLDIATWRPENNATPAPALLPQAPGSRADGEGVA